MLKNNLCTMSMLNKILLFLMLVWLCKCDLMNEVKEPTCLSRFDYDYKMLTTLIGLETTIEGLQRALTGVQKGQTLIEERQGQQAAQLGATQEDITTLTRKLQQTASSGPESVGNQYVRWGRTTCPANGTELVYTGYSAGSHYNKKGSSANYLCLPEEPQWGRYQDAAQTSRALVFGSEFESEATAPVFAPLDDEDIPCSVCVTRRNVVLMIPGRNTCYPGWMEEYRGYLVGGKTENVASTEFVCLDDGAEAGPPDRRHNHNGNLFYLAEVRCGSLPCPPYVDGRELTCVVCSK